MRAFPFVLLTALMLPSGKSLAQKYTGNAIFDPPPHIQTIGAQQNRLFKMGYLDVTLYDGWGGNPVDTTGSKDSYLALQKAIDDAYDYQLATFFPPGTYKTSNTLRVIRKDVKGFGHSCNLTGSNKGKMPVIRLADNAPGFNDAANPKPIIWFWTVRNEYKMPFGTPSQDHSTNTSEHQATMGFMQSIQNFIIDCNGQNGNSGAIGLFFRAAQASGIHNLKIIATGAHAGIWGIPARSSGGVSNVEVIGGQYGIHMDRDAGSALVSIVLKDQTEHAIVNEHFVPAAIIGFHIVKKAGAGVVMHNAYGSAGGSATFYDGIIEVAAGATAFSNSEGLNLYLKNVFVKDATTLIKNPQKTIVGSGTWNHIKEYSYTDARTYSGDPPYEADDSNFEGWALVNGKKSKDEIVDIAQNAAQPPSDIVSRHGIERLPSFEDDDAVVLTEVCNAKGNDDADDFEEIQKAVDTHKKICVPKGRFRLSKTLTLRAQTILFGIDRNIARIYSHTDWKPTAEVPVIQTVNDANATTWLGPMSIGYQVGNQINDWFTALDWRAGRNSVTFGMTDRFTSDKIDNLDATQPHCRWRISGNGGGRWYFWGVDKPYAAEHPDYRHLRIDNTHEPLWMYGCNLEKGAGTTRAELNSAQNIRIFSVKVEMRRPTFRLNSCSNVGIFSSGAFRHPPGEGLGYYEVMGSSNNIVLANISPQKTGDPAINGYTVIEKSDFGTFSISYPEMVSVFKRGDINDASMARAVTSTKPCRSGNAISTGLQLKTNALHGHFISEVTLPASSHISLSVYNLSGKTVMTIFDGKKDKGKHFFSFAYSDISLIPISKSIYLIRLITKTRSISSRFIILE